MRRFRSVIITLLLAVSPAWGAATFTSVQTGDWDAAATWGFPAGPGVCHVTKPCMTDGLDAGDTVLLGNLAHAVTCSTNCSAGNSPSSDAGTIAFGAVSYTNTTASFTLSPGATFTHAGPVRQNNAAWTMGAGASIHNDPSYSSAPTTAAYTWSTRNTSSGTGGRLTLNGTVGSPITWTVSNLAANAACNSNACRAGVVGANSSNHQTDSGTVTCAYTNFSYLGDGVTASGHYGWWTSTYQQSSSFDHCTWSNSNTLQFTEAQFVTPSNATANLTMTGIQVLSPLVSGTIPAIEWDPQGSAGTRYIKNSFIQGQIGMISGAGPSSTQLQITKTVFGGTNTPGISGSASGSTQVQLVTDEILMLADESTDSTTAIPAGTNTRGVIARYQNGGITRVHSVGVNIGRGNIIDGLVIEGTGDTTSSFLSPDGACFSTGPLVIKNSIFQCGFSTANPPFNASIGSFVNMQGGATNATCTRNFYQNTYCSASADVTLAVGNTQGIGWEANNVVAGSIGRVDSNIVWRADGPGVSAVMWGNVMSGGHTVASDSVVEAGYNAVYNNTANVVSGTKNYSSNVTAAMVAGMPTGDQNYSRQPSFHDSTRKLITFDVAYLGYPLGTAWVTGQAYSVGDIRSDSQATVYGGAQFNWRMISNTGGCATSGSTNRPMTGSGFNACWEPASMGYIEADVLAENTHTDSTIGAANLSMIGILNAWIRDGYRPVGADTALSTAGLGGIRVGAVDPVAPTFCMLPNSVTCQ